LPSLRSSSYIFSFLIDALGMRHSLRVGYGTQVARSSVI
jgi:hypothetical protein